MASRSSQPETESISVEVRDTECRKAILIATVRNVRKASKTEYAIVATGGIPTTFSRSDYDPLRVRDNEVFGRLVTAKELSANFLNAPFVPRLFLRRERLEYHATLIIAARTYSWSIQRRHKVSASNCLQLRDQYSNGLQSFFAKPTLRCHLMRHDDTFIDFVQQELAERAEMFERLVDYS